MKKIFFSVILFSAAFFISCSYSVFNGGTGGLIVDAESTTTPKRGIASVDVYAYTNSAIRDADFSNWREGSGFSPSNNYYGHTNTDANGNFVISNIVWTSTNPDFGKDADYTTLYLLFYHENYGLTKGQTVITSDSTSNTVYAELTAVRKVTALNISLIDVSNSSTTSSPVLVTVTVPQSTDTINAAAKVYRQTITGNGTISISYPRWRSAVDRASGTEYNPEIVITYAQSSDPVTWKACANADNATHDYSFLSDDFSITKTVSNSSFNLELYGKACRLAYPLVSGTYTGASGNAADGLEVTMMAKENSSSSSYTIECGTTTTGLEVYAASGLQIHGRFSGLGAGYYWTDTSYTGQYSTKDVRISVGGTDKDISLHSNVSTYNVSL